MDIKAKIDEILAKVKTEPEFLAKFKADPAGTVKEFIGVDISGDEIKNIAKGVVEKFNLDADGDGKIDFLEKIEDKFDADGDGKADILEKVGEKLDSDGDGKPDAGAIGNFFKGIFKKD